MRPSQYPFLWLSIACVVAPGPVLGQGEGAANPDNVVPARPPPSQPAATPSPIPPDLPVRPAPSLRLVASEPDLASLPQAALPAIASPASRPDRQRDGSDASRHDAAGGGNGSTAADGPSVDHSLERISALPVAPESTPSAREESASPSRAGAFASWVRRVDTFVRRANLPPWSPDMAVGLVAFVVAWACWRLGRGRRARPVMDDEGPIQWGPPEESEAALRTMLLARRTDQARSLSRLGVRQTYATLGEALIAMQAAAAKPVPHPDGQDQSRPVGA